MSFRLPIDAANGVLIITQCYVAVLNCAANFENDLTT